VGGGPLPVGQMGMGWAGGESLREPGLRWEFVNVYQVQMGVMLAQDGNSGRNRPKTHGFHCDFDDQEPLSSLNLSVDMNCLDPISPFSIWTHPHPSCLV